MTTPAPSPVTGRVKFYRTDDGWGRIERDDGGEQVFFHVSNLLCSPPYEGEELIFEVVMSSVPGHERDHEAVKVQRKHEGKLTGDVVEWQVEPGTWQTCGKVAPDSGGEPLLFSARDFPSHGACRPKPRPLHAASFRLAETPTGRRAVDIELDQRYPFLRFAYLGKEDDVIAALHDIVLPENWDYRHSVAGRKWPILYNYLHFTFAKLRDEDRIKSAPDKKKIRVREDLETPLATFNTGLVDPKYKSIYALCEANEPGHTTRWKFRAFCIPGEQHGKILASYFNPLPGPAEYFHKTTELFYDPEMPLHLDYTHILNRNRGRLPDDLLTQVRGMDERMAVRVLSMHLDQAIDVAKKRALEFPDRHPPLLSDFQAP